MATPSSVLVVLPTYNEAENLLSIVERVRRAVPTADILIVDDSSPDGSGDIADEVARRDRHVRVLHRTEKAGLGVAYVAGFRWGLERGYRFLVEMDADGSHPAETLPEMIDRAERIEAGGAEALVIGSRWTPGGSVVDWPRRRELLSRTANLYARAMLGIRVRDSTAGFRVFSASALRRLDLNDVNSHGYCFQIDLTLRMLDLGATVEEVPIVFRDRIAGESKMSGAIVREAMWKVTVWGMRRAWRRVTGRTPGAITEGVQGRSA